MSNLPDIDQFEFTQVGEGAVEAGKSQGGSRFNKIEFFDLDDGETAFLRFLWDSPEWVYCDQHAMVPTKNPPADYTGTSWPKAMPATCRYWKVFNGFFSDCFVCDSKMKDQWGKDMKPKSRVWCVAQVREEVFGDGTEEMGGPAMKGKRLGFKDALREIEEKDAEGNLTGNKTYERRLVVINQSSFMFFDGLQSIYTAYGTVCDRDYLIQKKGKGKDAKWPILPMDPVEGCNRDNAEWWAKYDEAQKEQGVDIPGIKRLIVDRASDDYFARFIDPNKTPEPREGQQTGGQASGAPQGAPAHQQAVQGTPEPDAAALQAMKDRVRAHVPGAAAAAPAAAAPAAAGASTGPRDFG